MNGIAATDPNKQNLVPFYLVLLYIFLEFGRPQHLIPFIGKLHLPAFIVVMMGIFLIISHRFTMKVKQTFFFVLLMLEMTLHGPFAVNNYWAFQMFYVMSVTFIGYCGIIAFVDTQEKYDKFIFYWFLTFIFLSFIGIKNKGVGIGGFIGDENDFCMALNMVLPFTIFSMFMEKNKKQKLFYILITGLILFVIVLTKSRGGFVGLVAVIGYSILRSNKKALLTLLIGIFGIFIVVIAPSGYWQEMGTISDEATKKSEYLEEQSGTGAQRLYSWKLGWNMFLENPIVGIGQGNYPWHVKDQEERLKLQWKERSLGGRAAHSLYFTLLPELGLVGLTIFVSMLLYTWKDLNWLKQRAKNNRKILTGEDKYIYYTALSMEASIIGYLISSVFISTLYYPNLWLMLGFVVAFKNIIENSKAPLAVAAK